jgi:hypothetical protein
MTDIPPDPNPEEKPEPSPEEKYVQQREQAIINWRHAPWETPERKQRFIEIKQTLIWFFRQTENLTHSVTFYPDTTGDFVIDLHRAASIAPAIVREGIGPINRHPYIMGPVTLLTKGQKVYGITIKVKEGYTGWGKESHIPEVNITALDMHAIRAIEIPEPVKAAPQDRPEPRV